MQEKINFTKEQYRPKNSLESLEQDSISDETVKNKPKIQVICKSATRNDLNARNFASNDQHLKTIQSYRVDKASTLLSHLTNDESSLNCECEQQRRSHYSCCTLFGSLDKYSKEFESLAPHLCRNIGDFKLNSGQFDSNKTLSVEVKTKIQKKFQTPYFDQVPLQNQRIKTKLERTNTWENLEMLNLAGNQIGNMGIKILSCDTALKDLKFLDLSLNHIDNEGMKFIAESSIWIELKVLILNDVSIDHYGVKFLSANDSWNNLEELSLQDNPLIGDLGALELSCNKVWKELKSLNLSNSDVRELGFQFLKRNNAWKNCHFQGYESKNNLKKQLTLESTLMKSDLRITFMQKKLIGELSGNPSHEKFINSLNNGPRAINFVCTENHSRGGGDEKRKSFEEIGDESILSLLEKINRYIRKIQTETSYQDERHIYIEPLGKNSSSKNDIDSELFELATETKKRLLDPESDLKVLLLTGEVGTGKSLFCEYLRRLILTASDNLPQDSDETIWIPLLIDLSRKRDASSHPAVSTITLSGILRDELALTENEIKLLQVSESKQLLPRFLFIFDEFNHIQSTGVSEKAADNIQNNFCASVDFESFWKNAKIIITCRSELISEVSRRELLFGPLEESTREPIPNSFSEFAFKPFTDTQITSYLRRFCILKYPVDLDNHEKPVESDLKSWNWVKNTESFIDSCELRELARIPLFLTMLVEALPQRTETGPGTNKKNGEEVKTGKADTKRGHKMRTRSQKKGEETNHEDRHKFKKLSRNMLYELCIKQSIDETVKKSLALKTSEKSNIEEANVLTQRLVQRLQHLALSLCNDPLIYEADIKVEQTETDALLPLCPLLKFEGSGTDRKIVFSHKSFRDYFIATVIEEEIKKFEADDLFDPTAMVLNKRNLLDGSVSISVFQFLVNAASEKTFISNALVKLLQKSRFKEIDTTTPSPQTPQKKSGNSKKQSSKGNQLDLKGLPQESEQYPQKEHHQHRFSIAAANAITILNATGYDFKLMDFNDICIAGANLTQGLFEKTTFTGADLQGVNFSGAWLKDTKFVTANMIGVQLGIIPDLQLKEDATCLAHSSNGEHMIVGTKSEIIVFKKHPSPKLQYKEIKRLESHVGEVTNCSFSPNGKYIVAGGDDEAVQIWDIEKEDSVQILRGHVGRVKCEFSQDTKLISIDYKTAKTWVASANGWTESLQLPMPVGSTTGGLVSKCSKIIFIERRTNGPLLYHSGTGKLIRKLENVIERPKAVRNRFSSDGKQIALSTEEKINILDCIRGHMIKALKHANGNYYSGILDSTFSPCGTLMLSAKYNTLQIQNIADREYEMLHLNEGITHYSIDPAEPDQITLTLKDKKIVFLEVEIMRQFQKTPLTKGAHDSGLSLAGTNIDDSLGLSEENILIFDQNGDYFGFEKENIQELILNDRKADMDKITEIKLNIGYRGAHSAQIIGRSGKWINLERLDLSGNNISDKDALNLGSNLTWKNLQELILNANNLSGRAITGIADNPCWKNLRKLDLALNKITDVAAKSLGKNSIWENLEELNLRENQIGDAGAVGLGQNKSWKQIKKIDLSLNKVGDNGVSAIVRNQTWRLLEELGLSNNNIGDKGAAEIGANTTWENLKILSLEANHISDEGATAITKNNSWRNLEELYVYDNQISEKWLRGSEKSKAWSKLQVVVWTVENEEVKSSLKSSKKIKTVLNLNSKDLNDVDAIIIGRSKVWAHLQVLRLERNIIGDIGVTAIANHAKTPQLKELYLQQNIIGDEGAVSIGMNTAWTRLEKLILYENEIGDKGAEAIGSNTVWSELKYLHLSGNEIKGDGGVAIGANNTWSKLESLFLSKNELGNKGAAGISKNTNWKLLKTLGLENNQIGDEGAVAIGSNTVWVNLRELILEDNEIGDKGAVAIGNNRTWSRLNKLHLSGNRIGDEGAKGIGANTAWANIYSINLKMNQIGAKGAVEIGKNTSWTKLRYLDLSHNKIGDEGTASIASNIVWTNLDSLELEGNAIGDKGAVAIGTNSVWKLLSRLGLNRNNIGDEGAVAIGTNTVWECLSELSLGENEIGDKGASAIGNNTVWESLALLELHGNKIGDDGAAAIAANTTWTVLNMLCLGDNEIGDRGAIAIGSSPTLRSLYKLTLNGNKIGNEGVISMGQNINLDCLETIHLYNNSIKDEGIVKQAFGNDTYDAEVSSRPPIYVFTNPAVQNLLNTFKNRVIIQVSLPSQGLTDDDVDILVQSLPQTVEIIELSENYIGERGVGYLALNSQWKRLKKLDLSANKISDKGAQSIGSEGSWPDLQDLNLSNNHIGDNGAISIQRNVRFRSFKILNLSANKIGDRSAIAIGKRSRWTHLEELYLNENEIGDEGASAIGQNALWKKLTKLEIHANKKITQKGKEELKRNAIFGSFVHV